PAQHGQFDASQIGGVAEDVWLIGNGNRLACIEADTDLNGRLKDVDKPLPDSLGTFVMTTKQLENGSRFDFIYVVTPPSITIETMQNPNDPTRLQYTPK